MAGTGNPVVGTGTPWQGPTPTFKAVTTPKLLASLLTGLQKLLAEGLT